jgi:RecA-family ATPase
MSSATDILSKHGIHLASTAPGQHYAICPECSEKRKPANQKKQVLGVLIDADGVTWHCNHCDFRGGGYFNSSARSNGRGGSSKRIAETYRYTDEHRNLLFEVVRFDPKGFSQRRPDGRDGWLWNLHGVRRVPYRLADLKNIAGKLVVFVEGERDVDNVFSVLDIRATCNPGGAGKWRAEFNEFFKDCDAIVIGDNDDPGRNHMYDVARNLHGVAKRVRTLDLGKVWAACRAGGDISDWIAVEENGQAEFMTLIETAAVEWTPEAAAPKQSSAAPPPGDDVPPWSDEQINAQSTEEWIADDPPAEPNPKTIQRLVFLDMSRWDDEPIQEQDWTTFNRIPRRQCVLFSGEGGGGKSSMGLHECVSHVVAEFDMLATARPAIEREWLGALVERGPAMFIDAEDDESVMHRRLAVIASHYNVKFADLIQSGLHLVSWFGQEDTVLATVSRSGKMEPTPLYRGLLEAAGDIKPISICIASCANVFVGNESDRPQVQQFVNLMTRVAIAANGSVTLIAHPSQTGITTGSGISGSTQWHNAVRARFYLQGIKPENGEPTDTDLRELVFKKNNYGPISESVMLRYRDGMFLPVAGTNGGGSLDKLAQERRAEDMFLDLLARFTRENRNVGHRPGTSYAPALFAREEEAKKLVLSSKALEAAMRRLFKDEKIVNEPYGKRPSYRIVRKI